MCEEMQKINLGNNESQKSSDFGCLSSAELSKRSSKRQLFKREKVPEKAEDKENVER